MKIFKSKKFSYILVVLFFSVSTLVILLNTNPLNMTSFSYAPKMNNDKIKTELEKFYDLNFRMEKIPAGNFNTYLPRLDYTDLNEALRISELFGITKNFTESYNEYSFYNEGGSLQVFKYESRVVYSSDFKNRWRSTKEISELQAIEKCAQFIQDRFEPSFTYEEAEVNYDGSVYEVTFINRIGNLRNYAFPTTAAIDSMGSIKYASIYFTDYDRLSQASIKTMEDAYCELPLYPLGEDSEESQVDLKKCNLVYHYQDSVVQPAYRFEGEVKEGKSFSCFINAAVYK